MSAGAAIVPRWEWRTFGQEFGYADRWLAGLVPERSEQSEDVYLLTPRSRDAVKFRHGVIDVKHLLDEREDGPQCWTPVLKAGFPLAADDLEQICRALATAPIGAEPIDSVEALVAALRRGEPDLAAVRMTKRRSHLTLDGCMIELATISADRRSVRTLAVEQEDADLVVAMVRELGLGGRANISYPHGLSLIHRNADRRFAVIDVGTNSVKLVVADRDGVDWQPLVDRSQVTRLGEGLDQSGRIGEEPQARTLAAIAALAAQARELGTLDLAAVGTAGLRQASNSGEVLARIRSECGIAVEVISGEDETRIAYRAVRAGLTGTPGRLVVFDTGGGSSQFTFGDGDQLDAQFSIPLGAVRITERFGLDRAVDRDVVDQALAAVASELSPLAERPHPEQVVGIGGAVTNLTAVKLGLERYDAGRVRGCRLELADIERQIEQYRALDADGRRDIPGLQPKRAEVILAGACIVRSVMDALGCEALTVSDRGLRHGMLLERFGAAPAGS
jgi:exopolyphosphatase/guanosine-5'-triphosphate,3'-diphosphate pyrophosphatase